MSSTFLYAMVNCWFKWIAHSANVIWQCAFKWIIVRDSLRLLFGTVRHRSECRTSNVARACSTWGRCLKCSTLGSCSNNHFNNLWRSGFCDLGITTSTTNLTYLVFRWCSSLDVISLERLSDFLPNSSRLALLLLWLWANPLAKNRKFSCV